MKSVLFLDIDGVMVPFGMVGRDEGIYDHDPFDKGCVKILNTIIDQTDCEIIISSTWKHFFDLKQIQEIFQWNGVIKAPIDVTPNSEETIDEEPEDIKCHEISKWLSKNKTKISHGWCAIDDWDLSFGLQNFVLCHNSRKGLKTKGISEKIIFYLEN
ncbi:MAG TPA: HAD domain-containing protein [Candidatus Bathyarchaeia archaeon]|nr:HAD domain-containing protein [Candidatus Bathyarchaeia archaeon]